MISYKYSALDENNGIVKGNVEAFSESEVREILTARGQKLIRVGPDIFSKSFWAGSSTRKLSSQEIALFCKQLSIITRSGISISKGLIMIRNQSDNKKIKQVADNIYIRIQKGSSLHEAFGNCGFKLPLVLVNMIEIGEVSGNLDDIFKRMAEYFEKEAATRKKIISSLIYPVILICVSLGVVGLFTFAILPELVKVIKDTGGKIPMVTQIMMTSADFIKENYLFILLGMGLLIGSYIWAVPDRIKYKVKEYLTLKVPVLSTATKDFITAKFVRTMGILIKTGLPLMTVLETLEKVVGNETVSRGIGEAREKINKGESISGSLEKMGFFDPMVTNIIAIGEESGNLDDSLLDLADYYDEKFDTGVTKLLSLLEPIFTLGMGVVIGTIVLSAMMPMFNMIGNFSNIRR